MINILPSIKKTITNRTEHESSYWKPADAHPTTGKISYVLQAEISAEEINEKNKSQYTENILPIQEPNARYIHQNILNNLEYPLSAEERGIPEDPELSFLPPITVFRRNLSTNNNVSNEHLVLKVSNTLSMSMDLFVQKKLTIYSIPIFPGRQTVRLITSCKDVNNNKMIRNCESFGVWFSSSKRAIVSTTNRQEIRDFRFVAGLQIGLEVELSCEKLMCTHVLPDCQASDFTMQLDGADLIAVNGKRVINMEEFRDAMVNAQIEGTVILKMAAYKSQREKLDALYQKNMEKKQQDVRSLLSNIMLNGLDSEKTQHTDDDDDDSSDDDGDGCGDVGKAENVDDVVSSTTATLILNNKDHQQQRSDSSRDYKENKEESLWSSEIVSTIQTAAAATSYASVAENKHKSVFSIVPASPSSGFALRGWDNLDDYPDFIVNNNEDNNSSDEKEVNSVSIVQQQQQQLQYPSTILDTDSEQYSLVADRRLPTNTVITPTSTAALPNNVEEEEVNTNKPQQHYTDTTIASSSSSSASSSSWDYMTNPTLHESDTANTEEEAPLEDICSFMTLVCVPNKDMEKSVQWGNPTKVLQISNFSATWKIEIYWVSENGVLILKSDGEVKYGSAHYQLCSSDHVWLISATSRLSPTNSSNNGASITTTAGLNTPFIDATNKTTIDGGHENNQGAETYVEGNSSAVMIIKPCSASLVNNKCTSIFWSPLKTMSITQKHSSNKTEPSMNKAGDSSSKYYTANSHIHIQIFDGATEPSGREETSKHIAESKNSSRLDCIKLMRGNQINPSSSNYTWKFIEHPISHFARANTGSYQQRRNESPVEEYVNNTRLMWQLAPTLNALIIFAEHIYFGGSVPKIDVSSEEALVDYVSLANLVRREWGGEDSAIIAFGGSYGGMLAAWMRIMYPAAIDGAISASAPIWGFPPTDCAVDSSALVMTYAASTAAGSSAKCIDNISDIAHI